MSERVNIPTSITDPHYRYKMPKMNLKEESRLNGVKTNIRNLKDVADALRIPGSAIIKYFCAEVGASQDKETIIMGSHRPDDLAKLLDKFIVKYVLCTACHYPELRIDVDKKNLLSTCNACGKKNKLDMLHKAGKQLYKDMPQLLKSNPEFKGKINTNAEPADNDQFATGIQKGGKQKKRKNQGGEAVEAEMIGEEKVSREDDLIKTALEVGAEINVIDAKELTLDSDEIDNAVAQIDVLIEEGADSEKLLKQARQTQISLMLTPDYKIYILMCGIFGVKRSPVKHWAAYEQIFAQLATEHKDGQKRIFQAIILLFMRYPEMKPQAATFMKVVYDGEFFTESFLTDWFNKKLKLDKSCCLYNHKAEREMRSLLGDFIKWLTTAEYGEEEYDEETVEQKPEKVEPAVEVVESEAARQARMIKEMQAKQNQAVEEKPVEVAEANEEEKVNNEEDIGNMNVEEDFDFNAI